MTEKEETATAVLDEDLVKEIVEGKTGHDDDKSRLVRLEQKEGEVEGPAEGDEKSED